LDSCPSEGRLTDLNNISEFEGRALATFGGKSHIEKRWGTTFINVAGLTRYHTAPEHSISRSWLLTFTDGMDEVTARCYLHGDEFAPQGWYAESDRTIKLSKPFKMP
jgi:hypothetical protein